MKTKVVPLKRSAYESAIVASKMGRLYGREKISQLSRMSFDEILKFMEENGFKDSIDKSFIQYEGFYLVENVLNSHLSKIYDDVLNSINSQNKILYESYYLKYQIHNLMSTLRCKKAGEKDVSPFLIGDERRKQKFLKSFEMKTEDMLVYLSKKLGFNSDEVLKYSSKGLFELENYLYSKYYEDLSLLKFEFNGKDEKVFIFFIQKYIDLINARSLIKLKVDNQLKIPLEALLISGGKKSISELKQLFEKDFEFMLSEFDSFFNAKGKLKNQPSIIDKLVNKHKQEVNDKLNHIRFGSPFYVMNYLFEVEYEMSKLRVLLKAKSLSLNVEEIEELIE